ncbi:MAG: hypothetical protein AAFV95_04270 [Bacteroidota bacterium]
MKYFLHLSLLATLAMLTTACGPESDASSNGDAKATTVALSDGQDSFKEYWYNGKAEINSYRLEQARYGEMRQGEAVLIFVTEPFSRSKQVKLDNGSANPKDNVSVLKCNATRNFITGIYPYSTMQSIFTPVELKQYPNSLKTATSLQEWCGHTYLQLNLDNNKYKVSGHSYFESEGDEAYKLPKAMLEDEVFNRIRINPKSLPTGSVDMIPSTLFTRLKHTPFQSFPANASMKEEDKEMMVYTVDYPKLRRQLKVRFNKDFPHDILSWEETYPSGYGGALMTTKATRKEKTMLDYWQKNSTADENWRIKLRL